MSLHPGMKYKTKRTGNKVCEVIDPQGNEVIVKCGRKGKPHVVNSENLHERAKWMA